LFHCQNQEKICSNTITKDPTGHHTSSVSLFDEGKSYQKTCAFFGPPCRLYHFLTHYVYIVIWWV